MDLSRHFILLNGEAKTLQIDSIERFGSNAFRVRFKNNTKSYTYGADKVVWLSNPEWIDVANSKVYIGGTQKVDIREVWKFVCGESVYWRVVHTNGYVEDDSDEAYFSISKNEIVVPEKAQFKDGESFYSNLFHEMTHSTGHESQLARIKPTSFGSAEYAREELVAELSAALTAQRFGMAKHIKEDSASYLKSWLGSLKEEPQFIKSTLLDVKKASSKLSQHIEKVAQQIEMEKTQGKSQSTVQTATVSSDSKVEQQEKSETVAAKSVPRTEPVFYASIAYLQNADDTQLFDRLARARRLQAHSARSRRVRYWRCSRPVADFQVTDAEPKR